MTAVMAGSKRFVVYGTAGGVVYISHLDRTPASPESIARLKGKITRLAISQDGATIAALSFGGDLRVIRLPGGAHHDFQVSLMETNAALSLTPSGDRLALAVFDVYVIEVDAEKITTMPSNPPPDGGKTAYDAVVLTETGRLVAAALESVDIWDTRNPAADMKAFSCPCSASDVSLARDGELAHFGTSDGHAVTVSTSSGKMLRDKTVSIIPNDAVQAVAGLAEKLTVAGTNRNHLYIWSDDRKRVAWDAALGEGNVTRISTLAGGEAAIVESQMSSSKESEWWIQPWLLLLNSHH
ncbi:hypothetical protein [Streptomyces sp. NPDC053079]|uniref:hypothetical protein n=1 Tax=Streptomyces sp. NPDC053079 TaxID=3365697 RepID=UPI0037D75D62